MSYNNDLKRTAEKTLHKVHFLLISEYLSCDEMTKLSTTCKTLRNNLTGDFYFQRLQIDAYFGFFT
jgi:hypothetical protein